MPPRPSEEGTVLYIRSSLMRAKPGREHEVAALMDQLVTYYKQQDGFVYGYKLKSADETGDIGRVTIWKSEEAADLVAQSHHVLALRSDLMPLLEDGSHEERSFWAEEESKPLTQLLHKLGIS
jgi:quinol monooxygenase YgiN